MTPQEPRPSRAGKTRGEYAKSKLTRTAILDAALEVFAESGYQIGSLREIAGRVGMSEAGLLHHFPHKQTLLLAVLDRRDELSPARAALHSGSASTSVRALVTLAEKNAAHSGLVKLYSTLAAESTNPLHPAHEYFVDRYSANRDMLQIVFAALEREGRLASHVTPRAAAIATVAMMDGLQVQWLLDTDAVDMAKELRRFLEGIVTIEWDAG